jgi:hypothetical protein
MNTVVLISTLDQAASGTILIPDRTAVVIACAGGGAVSCTLNGAAMTGIAAESYGNILYFKSPPIGYVTTVQSGRMVFFFLRNCRTYYAAGSAIYPTALSLANVPGSIGIGVGDTDNPVPTPFEFTTIGGVAVTKIRDVPDVAYALTNGATPAAFSYNGSGTPRASGVIVAPWLARGQASMGVFGPSGGVT